MHVDMMDNGEGFNKQVTLDVHCSCIKPSWFRIGKVHLTILSSTFLCMMNIGTGHTPPARDKEEARTQVCTTEIIRFYGYLNIAIRMWITSDNPKYTQANLLKSDYSSLLITYHKELDMF